MEHAVTSTELLGAAVEAYDAFAHEVLRDDSDPEVGVAQAYACGRRALAARAGAREWSVPALAATRVGELARSLAHAPAEERLEWLELFPHAVLEAVERRQHAADAPALSRRRFSDRVRHAAVPRDT
jgi:hypothetical protein